MSSSPISSQRGELPLDSYDPFPISLLIILMVSWSTWFVLQQFQKWFPQILSRNWIRLFVCWKTLSIMFSGFIHLIALSYRSYHSSLITIRFICFFPAALFLIYCLSVSTLHSHTATGKFSVVDVCSSLNYAQKRTKILFYYKCIVGTHLISP